MPASIIKTPARLPLPTIVTLTFVFWVFVLPSADRHAQLLGRALDDGKGDQEGTIYYEKHIRPLFAQHCYECHSKRAKEQQGKLLLDSQAGWVEGGESGSSVVPGDVEASLLIRAVRYADEQLQMPPVKPLSADDIAHLEHWVRMGAPGPSSSSIEIAHPSDPKAGKSHWAFRPLGAHSLPTNGTNDWPVSSIDRFILQSLETKGLKPVSDAEPRDLVRRIYFQLTGLPPTLQEVEAYLAENPSNRAERLVDCLLDSPAFGQRWGRHWLDLARYADSNGLDENFLFREAWRYRNWVIDSINQDMPFDRFVIQQVAGDLLPYESIEERDRQRIAAGFLVIGPKVLLGNKEKNQRMEVADEQIDTLGRTFLGQTLGCARCHDHKFDPIPTADYYALAGVFTSTKVMEMRYMLGEQRVMERLVGLGNDGNEVDEAYESYWREQPKLREKKKKVESALKELKKEESAEGFERLLKEHPDGIADEAKGEGKTQEERLHAQQAYLDSLTKQLEKPPKIPPRAMIPSDVEQPADESIRLAGEFDRLGEKVPRGCLTVLIDDEPISIPNDQSGRLAIARWLVDPHGRAGQLTARVQANRVWHHLMGIGLVRTVDNFGRTGELPSHPELLDHLAQELIHSGWSIKSLIRQIVLSRTFGLSSQFDSSNEAIDPENRLLWRAHRRRLDPESFRDAMLASAGQLDLKSMDSTVGYLGDQATAVGENKVRRRTDFPCRSIYLPVIRNDLPEIFNVFDFADPHATTGARPRTIVPTQSLFILNNEMMTSVAEAMARRILLELPSENRDRKVDSRIEWMFERILNVHPTKQETDSIRLFLQKSEEQLVSQGVADAELRSIALACHALFASSRFQFLE